MPIVKCSASKATPAKGIAYIMDPEKVVAKGYINFVSDDPGRMAKQMLQTMHLHHKGFDPKERKYYHVKVAFDPADRPENGGTLTPEKADDYAADYAMKTWPDREVVWAVQDHGASIHIHFIVAACDLETGKKLDAKDADYRLWKDRAQDLAKGYRLSTLDWRKATREKRQKEFQSSIPIDETFAEQGMKARGKSTWKDELRSVIDQAAARCSSMAEFRTALESRGVTMTRCTEQTISYKLGNHQACRGDSLGGDYTVLAIRDALYHNRLLDQGPAKTMQADGHVRDLIWEAGQIKETGSVVIPESDRKSYREFGRLAGVKRSEVDAMCDHAPKATWEEKQEIWALGRAYKDHWWSNWKSMNQGVSEELSEAYKRRRAIRQYEWLLNPRNRKASLLGVLIAAIYLRRNGDLAKIDEQIQRLKAQQAQLRRDATAFKEKSKVATETLRQKGLSKDEYVAAVRGLQEKSKKRWDFSSMTEAERIQFVEDQIKENARRLQQHDRNGR